MDWLAQNKRRQPPYMDEEVCDERRNCFHKYFPDYDERLRVVIEFAKFSSMAGAFLDSDSIAHRGHMDPKYWWVIHGGSTPLLQRIALKLLAQSASSSCAERNLSTYTFIHSARRNKLKPKCAEDLVFVHSNLRLLSRAKPEYLTGSTKMWDIGSASSSCTERNWSTYTFIHSARRNKLKPKRAEDLVFVHSNLRLLSRAKPEYLAGNTKMWDIGGDDEDLLNATLSLDEPELKAIVFVDAEG